jgi:hypothetical protein
MESHNTATWIAEPFGSSGPIHAGDNLSDVSQHLGRPLDLPQPNMPFLTYHWDEPFSLAITCYLDETVYEVELNTKVPRAIYRGLVLWGSFKILAHKLEDKFALQMQPLQFGGFEIPGIKFGAEYGAKSVQSVNVRLGKAQLPLRDLNAPFWK